MFEMFLEVSGRSVGKIRPKKESAGEVVKKTAGVSFSAKSFKASGNIAELSGLVQVMYGQNAGGKVSFGAQNDGLLKNNLYEAPCACCGCKMFSEADIAKFFPVKGKKGKRNMNIDISTLDCVNRLTTIENAYSIPGAPVFHKTPSEFIKVLKKYSQDCPSTEMLTQTMANLRKIHLPILQKKQEKILADMRVCAKDLKSERGKKAFNDFIRSSEKYITRDNNTAISNASKFKRKAFLVKVKDVSNKGLEPFLPEEMRTDIVKKRIIPLIETCAVNREQVAQIPKKASGDALRHKKFMTDILENNTDEIKRSLLLLTKKRRMEILSDLNNHYMDVAKKAVSDKDSRREKIYLHRAEEVQRYANLKDLASDEVKNNLRKFLVSSRYNIDEAMGILNSLPEDKKFEVIDSVGAFFKTKSGSDFAVKRSYSEIERNLNRLSDFVQKHNEDEKAVINDYKVFNEGILKIADRIPSSKTDVSSFIVKYSGDIILKRVSGAAKRDEFGNPQYKKAIAKDILRAIFGPSFITTEHIQPHSTRYYTDNCLYTDLKDINSPKNYILECAECNSDRSNTPFELWIKQHPEMKKNTSRYLEFTSGKIHQMDVVSKSGAVQGKEAKVMNKAIEDLRRYRKDVVETLVYEAGGRNGQMKHLLEAAG